MNKTAVLVKTLSGTFLALSSLLGLAVLPAAAGPSPASTNPTNPNQASMVPTVDTGQGCATHQASLPLGGTVHATVKWGDGSSNTYSSPTNTTYKYASNGIYTVTISGTLTHFGNYTSLTQPSSCILSVSNWGIDWTHQPRWGIRERLQLDRTALIDPHQRDQHGLDVHWRHQLQSEPGKLESLQHRRPSCYQQWQ